MRKYYRPFHYIKSNAGKNDWKGKGTNYMLSWINLTKPQALETKLILARLDLARKNNYLIPKDCQKLPILLYYFLNNWAQFQKELSTIS